MCTNDNNTKMALACQGGGVPAKCHEDLAVGGVDFEPRHGIRDSRLGPEYLADYSSRGPTMDKRIKVSQSRI